MLLRINWPAKVKTNGLAIAAVSIFRKHLMRQIGANAPSTGYATVRALHIGLWSNMVALPSEYADGLALNPARWRMKFGKMLCAFCLVFFLTSLAGAADSGKLVYFDQPQSAKLFGEAEVKGQFWPLVRYFISQRIDTFCSVASSVMVLNALEVPSPVSRMTFPYSKFDEETFFTRGVLERQRVRDIAGDGLSLAELAHMLEAFDLTIREYHADTLTVDQFRQLAVAALKSTDRYVVVNFSRERVTQEGGGHFSPLAAYDVKSDRFLVLDTARYKYPPFWVKAEDLWAAMDTVDEAAKAKRGFLIIGRPAR